MGKSVSVTLGKGSLNHNNRVFSTENVDPSLTPNNVVLVRQRLADAYNEIFGKALEDYNRKQKRNDRKIPDYLEHIRHSKNGEKEFYEIIVQIGNRYDTGILTADAPLAKEIMMQYFREFVERNPNMRVFNAVIHMDEKEGTPHLHMDFIPVAKEQSRGLEVRNSMRQALQQQGFDFQPTQSQSDHPDIIVSRGKAESKIGGGRWLNEERAALGAILQQRGIEWEDQGVRRGHLTVQEYKACAEIVNKEIELNRPFELEMREPSLPMKMAGVKDDEIIVRRSSAEKLQNENSKLRAKVEIDSATMKKMDDIKALDDGFIQRALKETANKERKAQRDIETAYEQADALKTHYSQGTAEKYNELADRYNQLAVLSQKLKAIYERSEYEKKQLKESIAERVKKAVTDETCAIRTENSRLTGLINDLKTEIENWKQKANVLQVKVSGLCQVIYDMIRAVFTLKYGWKDKSPNPYKSDLTKSASFLVDALERRSRDALINAGHPELEKKLDGMGVSMDLEKDVQAQYVKHNPKDYILGD